MNFDLNIANYTKDELREMFDLPPNFDENMFDKKEAKLRETIINNNTISKETQVKILQFLLQTRNMLLNNSSGSTLNILEKIYNTSFDLKPTELKDSNEHMVQQRRDHPYLSSYPSQYFPGVINPLKKKTVLLYKPYFLARSINESVYSQCTPRKINLLFSLTLLQTSINCSNPLPGAYPPMYKNLIIALFARSGNSSQSSKKSSTLN